MEIPAARGYFDDDDDDDEAEYLTPRVSTPLSATKSSTGSTTRRRAIRRRNGQRRRGGAPKTTSSRNETVRSPKVASPYRSSQTSAITLPTAHFKPMDVTLKLRSAVYFDDVKKARMAILAGADVNSANAENHNETPLVRCISSAFFASPAEVFLVTSFVR